MSLRLGAKSKIRAKNLRLELLKRKTFINVSTFIVVTDRTRKLSIVSASQLVAEHSQHKSLLLAESKIPFNSNMVFGVFVFLLLVSASNREY